MWAPLMRGFNIVLSLKSIIIMFIGVAGGIGVGSMPGLTGTMGVALLIPVTFSMDPASGLILLASMYIGAIYGGSISAILLRVPGTPASIATAFDGHVMTKNGEGDLALKTSIVSSFVGGVTGALILIFLSPPLAKVALSFGPDEYFWVAIFGLSIIISLVSENPIKGFISASLGFFVGTIGMDPLIGNTRFAFGNTNLISGINVVVLLIGLYSIPQALEMIEEDSSKSLEIVKTGKKAKLKDVWDDIKENSWMTYIRSSILGSLVGVIPGAGANIASYLGYNEAKRWSKRPDKFGTGIQEGVAASEAANNGVVGGSLVPLLTLGVPGNAVSAVLIGGLMIQGLRPGPQLFTSDPDIVYSFMGAILFANLIMLLLGYYGANLFVQVVKIPNTILAPIVITLSMIGSYALQNSLFDVALMLSFGMIGYFMRKVNIKSSPAVLALILGPMAEENVRRALMISGGNINILFSSVTDFILITLIVLSLGTSIFVFFKERVKNK